MNKILLTMMIYPQNHAMWDIYNRHTGARLKAYAERHGFALVVLYDFYPEHRNWSWARIMWCRDAMQNGLVKDGDVITMIDADSLVMDGRMPPEFGADFSIAMESTGCLCAGLFSIRVSDWSRKFVSWVCSEELAARNTGNPSWGVWHENLAIYQALGMDFGAEPDTMGTTNNSPFSREELIQHVKVLPVQWNVTVHPDDYIPDPDKTDKVLKDMYRKDLEVPFDQIIIRHFAGGRIYKPLFDKYAQTPMKL
jgi:hypothetical protein